jgi:hypothetical protein
LAVGLSGCVWRGSELVTLVEGILCKGAGAGGVIQVCLVWVVRECRGDIITV